MHELTTLVLHVYVELFLQGERNLAPNATEIYELGRKPLPSPFGILQRQPATTYGSSHK